MAYGYVARMSVWCGDVEADTSVKQAIEHVRRRGWTDLRRSRPGPVAPTDILGVGRWVTSCFEWLIAIFLVVD